MLRELRLEKGMRQQDLANKLGEPQSLVSKYEAGERRLDVLELREICKALGVPLSEFVKKVEARLDGSE